ncbi:EutC [Desulforapulum autotrophicum HRM2]|uniref:Ethanolamine ammonia-lyase small subunit n=1 Tax=Desulforapulum autotrophicum (strain ATCC 43914 / DSM 3382 / VKM B-1955 / HRM2) TaxID=177437 RepID=C0QGK0_DESAH|nr:ethanolamine ammonia-lyase subunit EutC [Desulforapulum autotrophicum]ACN13475.1 EutC [Desulforapulum autotrophicum HRM2]
MNKSLETLKKLNRFQELTPARIGLERAGSSIATQQILNFDLDHARARDAVHLPFDEQEIEAQLKARKTPSIKVKSAAPNRTVYLQQPDLGRKLDDASRLALKEIPHPAPPGFDLGIVIADGLSTRAIHSNAIAFLDQFLSQSFIRDLRCAPVVIASQARVALADEIGECLNVRLSIILIGERPGLSASDSMGIYLTYHPKKGRTDAQRNCISNIRQGGLDYKQAARQLKNLVSGAFKLGLSGVHLKQTSQLK